MVGASSSSTSSKSVMQTVNRSHRFVIQGYSLVKGMGVGKHIASDLFTVGGYHWAIYFYPNGFINLSEFAAFCRSDTIDDSDTELRDAFNLYDQDKNGLIFATELYQVINRLGMKCSVDECHNMIKSVDSDGDGNVNFPEFKRMMSNNRSNVNNGE